MIMIIIRLLHPNLHSPTFLQNFANEEQSLMLGLVQKEKYLRYLSNLAVNGHPQELGDNATNFIHTSGDPSKIYRTKISAASHTNEGSRYHNQILLEDSM